MVSLTYSHHATPLTAQGENRLDEEPLEGIDDRLRRFLRRPCCRLRRHQHFKRPQTCDEGNGDHEGNGITAEKRQSWYDMDRGKTTLTELVTLVEKTVPGVKK